MRQGAGDLALVAVGRGTLDVVVVGLQPVMVLRGDSEAEDVHGLGLAPEADGQLLGDEGVIGVGRLQLERSVDRVVVRQGHEIHAAALGEGVHLVGRGCAFGESERPLHTEL